MGFACLQRARLTGYEALFRGRPVPACRLPGVALERILMLGRRIDMECIVESEHAHACLLISVFRDIGRVQAAVVITIGQDV